MSIFSFDNYRKLRTDETSIIGAIEILNSHPDMEMVSYNHQENIVIQNLGFLNKDEKDRYFIEIPINRANSDLITDIRCVPDEINVELFVEGRKALPSDIITLLCAFAQLKFRFTFYKNPFDFRFLYTAWVFRNDVRREMLRSPTPLFYKGIFYKEYKAF